ncbi:hypothetical protein [Mycobacterium sp. ACS4331]|uniref:hypothetical protein n=1 Tax=Mycobacterium sp. ACS4331 TaxID=1834121 RepID=UPI0007FC30BB|nr:hypothetical protein [Mycobacterium sp. ACS4331]OBF11361.1 hypothetical protein A5727_20780 [Mycobacterium sp. ACS4331]
MIRAALIAAGTCTLAVSGLAPASADPDASGETAYLIGACYDPSQPVTERPATLVYGCDHSSVMTDMTWTSWGADGATGTGIDDAVECQPNCAQGARLSNPIVVHAWNPQPPAAAGCPDGVQFYTDFTVAYPEGVPPWVQPGTSWTEDVDFIRLDGVPAVHFKNQGPLTCTPQNS